MKNMQTGYVNIDITGFFITIAIVAFVVGLAVNELCEWLWPFVKAAIHSWSA